MSAAKTSAPRLPQYRPFVQIDGAHARHRGLASADAMTPTTSLVSLVVSMTHTALSMSSVSDRSGRMESHELGGLSRIIMHPDFRAGMKDEPSGRVYSQWEPFFAMVIDPGIELQVLTCSAQCGSGH